MVKNNTEKIFFSTFSDDIRPPLKNLSVFNGCTVKREDAQCEENNIIQFI
jgi:hypothetical protein